MSNYEMIEKIEGRLGIFKEITQGRKFRMYRGVEEGTLREIGEVTSAKVLHEKENKVYGDDLITLTLGVRFDTDEVVGKKLFLRGIFWSDGKVSWEYKKPQAIYCNITVLVDDGRSFPQEAFNGSLVVIFIDRL